MPICAIEIFEIQTNDSDSTWQFDSNLFVLPQNKFFHPTPALESLLLEINNSSIYPVHIWKSILLMDVQSLAIDYCLVWYEQDSVVNFVSLFTASTTIHRYDISSVYDAQTLASIMY